MTKKVLVITDAQNEFITGALGNKECEAAVKNIVAAAESGEYYKVIITKDTHTADYLNTQEGKRLPVLHGQEGTEGYKIHPDIVKAVQEHYAPENVITVKKPTFGSPEFGKLLKTIWEEVTAAGEAGLCHSLFLLCIPYFRIGIHIIIAYGIFIGYYRNIQGIIQSVIDLEGVLIVAGHSQRQQILAAL